MSRTYIPKVELKQVNLNSHSAQLKMFNIFGGRGRVGYLRILSETGKTRKVGFRSYQGLQMKECFAWLSKYY